jgi:hypothetical protein
MTKFTVKRFFFGFLCVMAAMSFSGCPSAVDNGGESGSPQNLPNSPPDLPNPPPDPEQPYAEPLGVLARWDFYDNDASRTGTLAAKDLIIKDKTGNGNDLELRIYGGEGAIANLAFDTISMTGKGGSMNFSGARPLPGAEFRTLEDAPLNTETFQEGYTLELLYYLPPTFTKADEWMGLLRRESTYTGNTGFSEDVRANSTTGLTISNCKEVQFWTVNSDHTYNPSAVWSVSMDNGGVWYHIALVGNNEEIRMFVNGAPGFRDQKKPVDNNITGLYAQPNLGNFVLGTAHWRNNDTDSPDNTLSKFLHGNLETVRITGRALNQSEWLISDFTDHVQYGNNNDFSLKKPDNYNFVVIPDTQNTVKFVTGRNAAGGQNPKQVFDHAADYLAARHGEMKIAAMMHIGDVVEDARQEWQYWNFEKPLLTMIDAGIKLQMGWGNHDQSGANGLYAQYFRNSASSYARRVSDTKTNGYIHFEGDISSLLNSYMKINAGSYQYLVIQLGYSGNAFSTANLDYLKAALDANPDLPTIVFAHNLFDVSDAAPSEISLNNAGNSMWNVVKTYPQVFMMTAGHNHGSGWITRQNDEGKDVFMMLVDYQFGYNGGNAYLRFLEFDESSNKIYLSTFSPYAASLAAGEKTIYDINYMTGPGNEGEWDINFADRFSFYNTTP